MINEKNYTFIYAFGSHLRTLRIEKKLTQEQLAFDCNIPISQIGRIERGEINTSLSTLYILAKHLEIPITELFNFELENKKPSYNK